METEEMQDTRNIFVKICSHRIFSERSWSKTNHSWDSKSEKWTLVAVLTQVEPSDCEMTVLPKMRFSGDAHTDWQIRIETIRFEAFDGFGERQWRFKIEDHHAILFDMGIVLRKNLASEKKDKWKKGANWKDPVFKFKIWSRKLE